MGMVRNAIRPGQRPMCFTFEPTKKIRIKGPDQPIVQLLRVREVFTSRPLFERMPEATHYIRQGGCRHRNGTTCQPIRKTDEELGAIAENDGINDGGVEGESASSFVMRACI